MKWIISWRIIAFCSIGFIPSLLFAQKKKPTCHVKYLSAEHVYVDAGEDQGLHSGDRLVIRKGGKVIAELEVIYTAQTSASCKIVRKIQSIHIGDLVRILTQKRAVPSSRKKLGGKKNRSRREEKSVQKKMNVAQRKRRTSRFSGSVAAQWYHVEDRSSARLHFDQPGLRINFKAKRLWGKEYQFRLRARSRYNQRARRFTSTVPRREWRNRIYVIAFSYEEPEALINYKFGRILSNQFSGVGYLDGLLVQNNLSSFFHWGIFAGTQPEWHYSNFQTSLQKYGGYLNYRRGDYSRGGLETTLAITGEYHGATVSREFVYVQTNLFGAGRWSLYQSAELDLNRKWRKDRVNQSISLTNFYFYGNLKINKRVSLGLTFDDRKNYFTYETRTLADSLFDDAMRYGMRGNLTVRLSGRTVLFANLGARKRETNTKTTYSYSLGISNYNLSRYHLFFAADVFGFSNFFTTGLTFTTRFGKNFRRGHNLFIAYGNNRYSLSDTNRFNQWVRVNGWLEIGGGFFLSENYEYDWGDDMPGHRIYSELGYRF